MMDFRKVLEHTPELEYTPCPHCRKRGKFVAMTHLRDMSFGSFALFECPKCGTTLDKEVERMPGLIRLPVKSKVYPVIV
jgi:hypothetical protein